MREIPGFDGYLCDEDGNIYTTRKNQFRKMTPVPDKHGYMRLHLPPTVGAKRKNVFVHTLVALAFHGESAGRQINHKNTIRTDNRPENLEWVTAQENLADSWERTRANRTGEQHPLARHSDAVVRRVRAMYARGVKPREIVRQTGLKRETVKRFLWGRNRRA